MKTWKCELGWWSAGGTLCLLTRQYRSGNRPVSNFTSYTCSYFLQMLESFVWAGSTSNPMCKLSGQYLVLPGAVPGFVAPGWSSEAAALHAVIPVRYLAHLVAAGLRVGVLCWSTCACAIRLITCPAARKQQRVCTLCRSAHAHVARSGGVQRGLATTQGQPLTRFLMCTRIANCQGARGERPRGRNCPGGRCLQLHRYKSRDSVQVKRKM